jgi:hypothetical protein
VKPKRDIVGGALNGRSKAQQKVRIFGHRLAIGRKGDEAKANIV